MVPVLFALWDAELLIHRQLATCLVRVPKNGLWHVISWSEVQSELRTIAHKPEVLEQMPPLVPH